MSATDRDVFPETLLFNLSIDGIIFPNTVSAKLTHTFNSARVLTVSFVGQESLDLCRLGAEVELSWGRGNLSNLIDDKKFIGIIKDIQPRPDYSTFTAMDFTTLLAESQFVQYKPQDYIGEDLYFAAAKACNYKDIDVSRLTRGSGLMITKDMDLFGWKTRKEFVDACFDEMKALVNDQFHKPNTIKQWRYAIRSGKVMDFFLSDESNTVTSFPYAEVSIDDENIINSGVVSKIDTTRLINAITVVSSEDENIYVQLEDSGSQKRYGVVSNFISYKSKDKNELEDVAYKLLNRFKEPTISYTLSLSNFDNLDLGDIVEIDMPSLPKATREVVTGYEVNYADSLVSNFIIGQPKVTAQEFLDLLKEPTNR